MSKFTEMMKENRAESVTRRPIGPSSAASNDMALRMSGLTNLAGASMIPLDRIINDADQPRKEFDDEALQRLAASLKARGQLQPIRVRWSASAGHYVVVVGERRWRAAAIAGLDSIACVVVPEGATAEELLEDQLVENAIREDLKPVEQARAYKTLMDAKGWTLRELADRLHVHFTGIQKSLALLNLAEPIQERVDNGDISAYTAHAIASNVSDPAEQVELAERVISEGLSHDATREIARQSKARKPTSGKNRGVAKPKSKPLPNERTIKTSSGIKIIAQGRKGFTVEAWVEALREALESATAKIDPNADQAAA